MKKQSSFGFIFFVLLIGFVIAGDSLAFLPQPVRNASLQSRTFVVGLFPKWLKPKDRDAAREDQIRKLEKVEKGEDPNQQK